MATLGRNINSNTTHLPPGNTPKQGIITPNSKLAVKIGDVSNGNATDPSHD